jgi:hypothetical protein
LIHRRAACLIRIVNAGSLILQHRQIAVPK